MALAAFRMQTIQLGLAVPLRMAFAGTKGAGVSIGLALADVMAVLQAFKALDNSRLENELLDLKAQATYHEGSGFNQCTGGIRVEGFNENEGKRRAGFRFPHAREASFVEGNSLFGRKNIAHDLQIFVKADAFYHKFNQGEPRLRGECFPTNSGFAPPAADPGYV
jgi:hypothetical protein